MRESLATVNQNSKALLTKAKSLVAITNKILSKKKKDIEKQLQTDIVTNPLVWQDPDTNLMWQVEIDERRFTWDEAFEYAKELNNKNYAGYNDWRVPSIEELETILTKESHKNKHSYNYKTYIKKPLLNSVNMGYQWFWSATTNASYTDDAWNVSFEHGTSYNDNDKNSPSYVRCVRGEQYHLGVSNKNSEDFDEIPF